MFYTQKILFYCLLVTRCVSIYANELPPGVSGVAIYDYFKEELPPGTRGVYEIFPKNEDRAKYIGSSSSNINWRLADHYKKERLVPGDRIKATIFDANARQREILNYEKALIEKLKPNLNKHAGAPGRPLHSEQQSKLRAFYEHNQPILTEEGKRMITDLLSGKVSCTTEKMQKALYTLMRIVR